MYIRIKHTQSRTHAHTQTHRHKHTNTYFVNTFGTHSRWRKTAAYVARYATAQYGGDGRRSKMAIKITTFSLVEAPLKKTAIRSGVLTSSLFSANAPIPPPPPPPPPPPCRGDLLVMPSMRAVEMEVRGSSSTTSTAVSLEEGIIPSP